MKIIAPGDINKTRVIKRFECKRCGCIFEAENGEYTYQFSQRENVSWYECKCPTCKRCVTAK